MNTTAGLGTGRWRRAPGSASGGASTMAPEQQDSLLDSLRVPFLVSRWLLVAAMGLETAFIRARGPHSPEQSLALGLLMGYNAATLVLVHRIPLYRLSIPTLLALDFSALTMAASTTGKSFSPFLGQFYLLIFIGAMFLGLPGGLLTGIAADLITMSLALSSPIGWGQDIRDLIPYFLISGAFTGYLSGGMRRWFRSYTDAREREHQRRLQDEIDRHDMDLARRMQRAAMPDTLPPVPGLDLSVLSESAREVGGDFFVVLPEDGRVVVAVGDVSGKGLPAALAATSIGHLLPWLNPLANPEDALRRLNHDLRERLPESSFATMALIEIETATGRLRAWSAGHPGALVRRADTGQAEALSATGLLLGVVPDWCGTADERILNPGDALLLYTDGLSEARCADLGLFGEERIRDTFTTYGHGPAERITSGLRDAARVFGAVTDDLTLIVCKRTH